MRTLMVRELSDSAAAASRKTRGEVRATTNGMRRWMRKAHAITGLVLALNLLLVVLTGAMIGHRELLRLEEHTVSRTWLPHDYRPQDVDEVRSDIVITDLHSGRLFGPRGPIVVDVLTLGAMLLIVSGAMMYLMRRRGNGNAPGPRNGGIQEGNEQIARRTNG
jgi:uncharacterized iron-regulated membrane protein